MKKPPSITFGVTGTTVGGGPPGAVPKKLMVHVPTDGALQSANGLPLGPAAPSTGAVECPSVVNDWSVPAVYNTISSVVAVDRLAAIAVGVQGEEVVTTRSR